MMGTHMTRNYRPYRWYVRFICNRHPKATRSIRTSYVNVIYDYSRKDARSEWYRTDYERFYLEYTELVNTLDVRRSAVLRKLLPDDLIFIHLYICLIC